MFITNLYEHIMSNFQFCKSVEELYNSQRIVCGWFTKEVNQEDEWEKETFVLNEGYSLEELKDFLEKAKALDVHKNYCDFQIWENNNHLIVMNIDDCGVYYTERVYIPMIPKSLVNKF